jgi:hypothetical protein
MNNKIETIIHQLQFAISYIEPLIMGDNFLVYAKEDINYAITLLREEEKKEIIEVPLPLALTIMSIVNDICIQDRLDEKPYLTSEKLVRDEFSKLLELHRTGGG